MSDTNTPETNIPPQVDKICPFCAEHVHMDAKKCKHCGETIDVVLRVAEEARSANRNQPNVYMNAAVSTATSISRGTKSRAFAIILAFLFGGLGFHKFYLGQTFQGILYLMFCWTFIPAFIAFFEGIYYCFMTDQSFAQTYN